MNELILLVGVVAVSFSGPFNAIAVKEEGLDGYLLAGIRLSSAALLLMLLPAVRRALPLLRGHFKALLKGGIFLGAHFALWTGAFHFTSLSSAMIFLCGQPLLSLVFARDRGEKVTPALLGGLVLGTLGMILLGAGDLMDQGPRDLIGDLMVAAAGAAIVRYQHHTRAASRTAPIWAFNAVVWAVAGGVNLCLTFLLMPTGLSAPALPSPRALMAIAGLVLLCTYMGHGCFNYVMPRLKLLLLNLSILLEPIVGIALGMAMGLESDWPAGWRLAGALLVLVGVSWALLSEGLAAVRRAAAAAEEI